ncbi:hypothetical protein EJB05_02323, partial [Eragrostis curvula]
MRRASCYRTCFPTSLALTSVPAVFFVAGSCSNPRSSSHRCRLVSALPIVMDGPHQGGCSADDLSIDSRFLISWIKKMDLNWPDGPLLLMVVAPDPATNDLHDLIENNPAGCPNSTHNGVYRDIYNDLG